MSKRDIEASRRALLSYYTSQTIAHGGYIIAIVIGIVTVVSRSEMFTEPLSLVNQILLVSILSLLSALGIYIIGRTLWYGNLTGYVIKTELHAERSKGTIINQLQEKAIKEMAEKHPMIVQFFSSFNWKFIIGVFICSWCLLILLLIIYPYSLARS